MLRVFDVLELGVKVIGGSEEQLAVDDVLRDSLLEVFFNSSFHGHQMRHAVGEQHHGGQHADTNTDGQVVSGDGEDHRAGARPPARLLPAIEDALEALDPQADVLLDLRCPACGSRWSEVFDAGLVLWSDIRLAAQRLLSEVAQLARAFHWSERDILGMPASRRRFYLEAAG